MPVTRTAGLSSELGVSVPASLSEFTLAAGATQVITVTGEIAVAQPATPQGPAGPGQVNQSQHHVPASATSAAATYPQCFASITCRDPDCLESLPMCL